ncbi:hypothetical protein AB0E04_03870 [Streptomyces sp. NPDC048251]|uniref:hypothetical protein n=1 Tax=Streptomyces sp. NPDC048251 TaxID=3154501 RepID=UPI00341916E8
MSTVQPYPSTARWQYSNKQSHYEQTQKLALYWEPDGSAMSDDYLPDEVDAHELWRMWVDKYAGKYHQETPDVYAPWHVPIFWFVTSVEGGTFESAPHQMLPIAFILRENFLTHFTHPVHARTGEPVNWMRLPVVDRGWNAERAEKSGFIQEATGWKPSPLQPFMDVRQVGRAAGIYAP